MYILKKEIFIINLLKEYLHMTPEEKRQALLRAIEKLNENDLMKLFIHVCSLKYQRDVEAQKDQHRKDLKNKLLK